MAKKKHFLTQKEISKVMRNYGGGHRYAMYEGFTSYDTIFYKAKDESTLSIERNFDPDTGKEQVQVNITDRNGRIIRKDRYGIFFDTREILFDHTIEGDDYTYDFKKVENGNASRKKGKTEDQKLKEMIKRLEETVKATSDQNKRLVEANEAHIRCRVALIGTYLAGVSVRRVEDIMEALWETKD